MADVRPLPGIRYADGFDLAALVTPPFDVIAPEAQARYYARDPHNIIRLELGRDEPGDDDLDNRYTRAASLFAEWRLHGVLRQDDPSIYLYEQRFTVEGTEFHRLSLLARVRLEPWDAGVILPHERTLNKPKEDRLKLMRACAANFSPLMVLYDDPDALLADTLSALREDRPLADFTDEAVEGHRLWRIDERQIAGHVMDFFRDRQLYIADGHHRYETALAYRDEQAALRKGLDPDAAANFVMMALVAIEDPGLVVLPTHRILRDLDPTTVLSLPERLALHFTVEPLGDADPQAALAALGSVQSSGETAFVLVRDDGALLLRLAAGGREAMAHVGGENAGASEAWRRLDLAVLQELVLRQALDITDEMVRAGEHVGYTHDAAEALTAARSRGDGSTAAVLVNPTPPAAICDVARAGDRMPQKSTYFYPKLSTGLVINPLW